MSGLPFNEPLPRYELGFCLLLEMLIDASIGLQQSFCSRPSSEQPIRPKLASGKERDLPD